MEALSCNFSKVVINSYQNNVDKMRNIPDTFNETDKGNFNFIGFRLQTGIKNDKDDLLILDPEISQQLNDFDVCYHILYQLRKMIVKDYASYQEVLIDSDEYRVGKLVFLQRHFSPHIWDNKIYSWQGETIICSPNDKLIQYAVQRVNEERERRSR